MRPKSYCIACLVERAKYECDMALNDDREKIYALKEFMAFLLEHLDEEGKSPAFFGTEREKILKKWSGVEDPHREVKRRSNEVAKGLLPEAYKFYHAAASHEDEDKIEALIRIAAAANSMEYGVKGYSYNDEVFKDNFVHTLNEKLNWNRDLVISTIKERKKILYLTDNAGEIFFDAFVVGRLIEEGKEVVVSPKKAPVINDATSEDLKEAIASVSPNFGFGDRIKVIPSGSCIGVSLEEAEEEFLDVLSDERYLVIAKGMGNYEAISEFEAEPELALKGRLIYILRAKCEPIASSIGVKKGELVAKLV